MSNEWLQWGQKIEKRLAKLEKGLRFDCTAKEFTDLMLSVIASRVDLLELRMLASLARRLDPEIGEELVAEYNRIRTDKKDGEFPNTEPHRAKFYDKAAEAVRAKSIRYRGIWQDGQRYKEGDVVTCGGSAWYCLRSTVGRPSTAHDDFRLMVKAGRDGKPR